jgi:WD40 repeat protein
VATLSDFPKGILALVWSPDGSTVACGLLNGDIVLLDTATWKITRTLKGHAGGIATLRYTADGKTLISAGFDEINIRLWDLTTDTVTRTFAGHTQEVYALALSPDGKTLASGSADKTIRLWNLDSGANILTLTGHLEPVWALSFSKNSQTLFSGGVGDKTIRVWELPGGVNTQTLTQVSAKTYGLALSPDGKTLISAHDDKALRLWRDMPAPGSTGTLAEIPAGPQAPKLAVTDIRVSDKPVTLKSNHNGQWEPGEEAEVSLQVHNTGSAPLGKVVATLEVLTPGVKYLALAPSFEVPHIQPGEKRFLKFTLALPTQPLKTGVTVRLSLLDETARYSLTEMLSLAPPKP